MTSDDHIIQGFLKGSKKEFQEVRGWIAIVVRSRLWHNRVVPEDVIADTTMKLLVNLRDESFRLESSLKTYVQRIALYTLVDAGRRQKRLDPLGVQADPSDQENPHSQLEDEEEHRIFDRALSLLPQNCQDLFEMALHQELKYKEIARRVGSTEGAVKIRLMRCREKVAELVKKMR